MGENGSGNRQRLNGVARQTHGSRRSERNGTVLRGATNARIFPRRMEKGVSGKIAQSLCIHLLFIVRHGCQPDRERFVHCPAERLPRHHHQGIRARFAFLLDEPDRIPQRIGATGQDAGRNRLYAPENCGAGRSGCTGIFARTHPRTSRTTRRS